MPSANGHNGTAPPPALYSQEAEESVLGSILIDPAAIHEVSDRLRPRHFKRPENRAIYKAMLSLDQGGASIDMVTLEEALDRGGTPAPEGDWTLQLSMLLNSVPTSVNVASYARIVADYGKRRELLAAAQQIAALAGDTDKPGAEVLSQATELVLGVQRENDSGSVLSPTQYVRRFLDDLEQEAEGEVLPTPIIGWNKLLLGGLRQPFAHFIAARPKMGKCLAKGTAVVMFDGSLKAVEHVQVGDCLMGPDSKPRLVLATDSGQAPLYKVEQNRGIIYRVTGNHVLSLRRSKNEGPHKHGDPLLIEAAEYAKKGPGFKSRYKGHKATIDFPERDVPLEPYFLGLWLGDGHSYNVRITATDQEVIDYLHDYAASLGLQVTQYEDDFGITRGYTGGDQYHPEFSPQTELQKLGVMPNKYIPLEYVTNSRKKRLELLAGLIDSDGHYQRGPNCYAITQKRADLARQIKYLADTLGFQASIKEKRATIKDTGFEDTVYRVRISGDLDEVPCKVKRKQARKRKRKTDVSHTGIEVTPDGYGEYYGFTLDGDHLFLLEDMTVTHNSALVMHLVGHAAIHLKKRIYFATTEMSDLQFTRRAISQQTGIPMARLMKRNLTDGEKPVVYEAAGILEEYGPELDVSAGLTPSQVRARAMRYAGRHGLDLVVVDHIHEMEPDRNVNSRHLELGEMARSLRDTAKALGVPIIIVAQLNRGVESRSIKVPQLADFREAGALEETAYSVTFVHRDGYYDETADQEDAQLILAAHRDGPTGKVDVRWNAPLMRFENPTGQASMVPGRMTSPRPQEAA